MEGWEVAFSIELTQKGAADVLRDLVAGLGLGEVAELLVEHALELERKRSEESERAGWMQDLNILQVERAY